MLQKERSKENPVKIFVYGTLKVGGHFADAFNDRRMECAEATLKDAALYQVCNMYPGIVEEKGAVVHGELHTFCDAEKVLDHMDRIEGYKEYHADNLFDRQKVVVETEDGKEEEAFAYFFAHHDKNCKRIESGIWEI
jgi:gamma-glutamylcyclotransferase (GGCT)/AIG2-like uncharacterized protein YtfP